MSIEALSRIVEPFIAQGGRAVQITGGEPLCHPTLPQLLAYLRGQGLYSFLATSGYRHSLDLYRELKDCGLDILCVSINDIDESVNRLTRDAYDESMAAIRDACEAGLSCCVNVVVSDNNIQNLSVLSCYLAHRGVERIDLLRPVRSFDGTYIPTLSAKALEKLEETVKENPNFYRVENCFREYWEYTAQASFTCRDVAQRAIFVNADGSISPCSKLQQYRYPSVEAMMQDHSAWQNACR